MSLEASTAIKAVVCEGAFRTFLGETPLNPTDKILIAKKRLRWSTLAVLAIGSDIPLPGEVLGMLHLFQIIRTCDDAIDRRSGDFPDTAGLREYLLDSEVKFTGGIRVNQILDRCLSCYSPHKQRVINEFIDEMLVQHLEDVGRAVPGEYTFEDPLPYRNATNNPFADALAELTGSDRERFRRVGYVIQLIDDGLDWVEDLQEHSLNFFVGKATDIWYAKGKPKSEELDFLMAQLDKWPGKSFIAQRTKLNALYGTKNTHMRATRRAYRQEIFNQLPAIGGNAEKVMVWVTSLIF